MSTPATQERPTPRGTVAERIDRRWPGETRSTFESSTATTEVVCPRELLGELCRCLFHEWDLSFAGLIVEEDQDEWGLRYVFYGAGESGWVHVLATAPLADKLFPSIVQWVHAADWHERVAEDLYGIHFEGHPGLLRPRGGGLARTAYQPGQVHLVEFLFARLDA